MASITKNLNGNIPIGVEYTLKDVYIDCSQCQNCGRLIKNIYVISGNNKTYIVGSECVTALLNESIALNEKMRLLKKKLKCIKWIIAKCQSIIIGENIVWLYKNINKKWNANFNYRLTLESYNEVKKYFNNNISIINDNS